ncbi:hypothetical protein [Streptomyces candidus]|uniref:Protein kinase domain-containing protein n=1 Tax=Streptomyces candidus TaxID=67283 RepID=A0A7X0HKM8_9ACTN|nr:hypothetical protein [Streptomyces candidus]MBB6439416.1 hypothetical protein [Streptomyces candidus]GHH54824.1 hypothetical protein GCM10018773_58410 [Streptomyces candidus]
MSDTIHPASVLTTIPPQTNAPSEGRAEIEQLAGSPTTWELKTDRGGTTVWRVTGPIGQWALKIGRGEGAAVVGREAEVLGRLHSTVPSASYGARAKSNRASTSAWLLTPWLDGTSTWEVFRAVRDGKTERDEALAAAVDLATAIGSLHQSGWVHGDIQPHHSIHTPSGVRLIGCSWAWNMELAPSYAFHGGLLHLMPPELMARVESGERPVGPSQPDETYALAAGLWWAASNSWPLDYAQIGIDPGKFTAKALRQVLLRRWAPLGHIPEWPQLEEVLRPVLATRPHERPSALQLAQWLRSVSP